jgi:hypothetical protein
MTDDRGAAALADQMHEAAPSWDQHRQSHYWQDYADAILGEHGRFLPDGRDVDLALAGYEAIAMKARAEVERLKAALEAIIEGNGSHYAMQRIAIAALSPEPKP